MTTFKDETFRDDMFVGESTRRESSIFTTIQEFNDRIRNAERNRERIIVLVDRLDDFFERIVNQSLIDGKDQEELEGDALSILNTLKNEKLKAIGVASEL